jgi:hypothetical protein
LEIGGVPAIAAEYGYREEFISIGFEHDIRIQLGDNVDSEKREWCAASRYRIGSSTRMRWNISGVPSAIGWADIMVLTACRVVGKELN